MELLTHSKRRSFQNCNRYFFHRYEQGLELRAKRPGRRRGTIFGDALQAARDWDHERKTKHDLADPDAIEDMTPLEVALLTVGLAYDSMDPADQEEEDEFAIEQAKLEVVVEAYLLRYGMTARREVEFLQPLIRPSTGHASRTFKRAGKLDGLEVVGPKIGRVIEDKLMGNIQKAMIDRLPLDSQSSEYADALRSMGWNVEVSYRHTRYPGVNPGKEKIPPEFTPSGAPSKAKYVPPESLEDFKQRLREDMAARLDFYFDEQILIFPTEHMEDYQESRWGIARQIQNARLLQVTDGWQAAWPRNDSRCWEYGGCAFIPLCTKVAGAIDQYEVVENTPELSITAATYGNEEA